MSAVVVLSHRSGPVRQFTQGRFGLVDTDLASSVEEVGPGGGHTVLVARTDDRDLARAHATVLVSLGHPVATVLLPHGPAALLWVALTTTQMGLAAGRLPAALRAVAGHVWSGAWVRSVGRLRGVEAPFAAQVRSLLGPSVVELSPARRIWPARGPLTPGLTLPGGSLMVVGDDAPARVVGRVATALGAGRTTRTADLGLSRDLGDPRCVELLGFSADLSLQLPAEPAAACPSCGAELLERFCPYCHTRRSEDRRPELEGAMQ